MADTTTPQADTHAVAPIKADARTMTREDFANLRAMVAKVNDNALQPILREIVHLIGRTHGLDATEEDQRIADEAKKKADDEAKASQAEADRANAESDAKAAQAKRDLFVSMFGDVSATFPTNTATANPGAAQDAKPTVTTSSATTPKATPATSPKDAA